MCEHSTAPLAEWLLWTLLVYTKSSRELALAPRLTAQEASHEKMLNERAQIVLSVQPLVGDEDRRLVTDALLRLEGVRTAHVDVPRGVVRVDGAASDVELLATMEALGKRAAVVTHVRAYPLPSLSLSSIVIFRLCNHQPQTDRASSCCTRSCIERTQTRGVKPPPSSSSGMVKMQLFMKLLGRQVNCCD